MNFFLKIPKPFQFITV